MINQIPQELLDTAVFALNFFGFTICTEKGVTSYGVMQPHMDSNENSFCAVGSIADFCTNKDERLWKAMEGISSSRGLYYNVSFDLGEMGNIPIYLYDVSWLRHAPNEDIVVAIARHPNRLIAQLYSLRFLAESIKASLPAQQPADGAAKLS